MKPVSLRLVLVVPFVLQIFTAVGLTGYFSLRNGQKAVESLASQLRSEMSNRIDQHLDSYLETPRQINQMTIDAIDQGLLRPNDYASIGRYFWRQAKLFNAGYINYGKVTGEFAGAGQVTNNPADGMAISQISAATNQVMSYSIVNDRGDRVESGTDPTYDYRREAWYVDALAAGKPTWSKIYIWDGDAPPINISIAFSQPIYDAQDQIVGVIGVDLLLSKISDFLRQLQVSPNGKAFIIERNSLLVASSSAEQPFVERDGEVAKRLQAIDSRDPLIRSTSRFLLEQGNLPGIQTSQQLDFNFEGEHQYVQVTPWRDAFGLDWLVVITVPESDFMAQIHANRRTTILLCLLALLVSTLLGLLTARWIAQPVRRLSAASAAMANGQLDQQVARSPIRELDVLARSFNRMSEQLRNSFVSLETSNEDLETKVRDRTEELSQALQTLKQAQAQLVQQEKMSSLGQMVAGIAHEINNPVSFIHGNLAPLSRYVDDLVQAIELYQQHYPQPCSPIQVHAQAVDLPFVLQDLPHLIDSMRTGTDRICEIVLSLRNFSRLDEAQQKLVNLHDGIDSTLLLLQHRFKALPNRSAIVLTKQYAPLPPIECFAGQLNQVVMNLIDNAIDAIDAKFCNRSLDEVPRITIATATRATGVAIHISDNGCGMPEAVRSRMFDPFFTTKPVGDGTGLGLAISYQIIVEQHQGQLHCISTVNEGTQFSIELPLKLQNPPSQVEDSQAATI
ncbi:HAMP domain-containing protein [Microcoleus sp. FACHB-1515]|uniref:ATP-binding protein n=1 Tax=Cyanophyceae TaxID=3028117 RepID=UPI0016865E35|nr:ATP-binding protein [Microcoleus sp. FACHB-1515]MBD2091694.1 HAMP domain-containing protein [Microcoleus sp. FACHB-1515]